MVCSQYEIVVEGHLGARMEHVLEGYEVLSADGGCTRLVGWSPDDAALQGALARLASFGLRLVSVHRLGERRDHDVA